MTERTSAILAVHVYGNPCDVSGLQAISDRHGLKLLFDSAHALGSTYRGLPVGSFGDAEVLSFHATKILPVGEGGAVATVHGPVADALRRNRNFGNPGDDNCVSWGLNAKMCEFSAILGLAGLPRVAEAIAVRRHIAAAYTAGLATLPGIGFQHITDGGETSHQFFPVLIDPEEFGLDRNTLGHALGAENVGTRRYFFPAIHHFRCYLDGDPDAFGRARLPITERVASRILCLPISSHMDVGDAHRVVEVIQRIHAHAEDVKRQVRGDPPRRG